MQFAAKVAQNYLSDYQINVDCDGRRFATFNCRTLMMSF
jgi:hypothetical protein